jgi:monothiol glutaredoxin
MSNVKEISELIREDISTNKVVLFMKGSKLTPQCGFSARVVQILNTLKIEFIDRDVLESQELRQGIKDFSNWPTVPQLYVEGQFVGGCDIITQMYENGELQELFS